MRSTSKTPYFHCKNGQSFDVTTSSTTWMHRKHGAKYSLWIILFPMFKCAEKAGIRAAAARQIAKQVKYLHSLSTGTIDDTSTLLALHCSSKLRQHWIFNKLYYKTPCISSRRAIFTAMNTGCDAVHSTLLRWLKHDADGYEIWQVICTSCYAVRLEIC